MIHRLLQDVIPITSIPIDEAQAKFNELIDSLREGDEIIITRDDLGVARLVGGAKRAALPPQRERQTRHS